MLGLGNSIVTEQSFHKFNSYSMHFDGTNECVNLGNSSDIKLTTTDTSAGTGITVSAWYKHDAWDGTASGYGTVGGIVNCIASGGWGINYGNRIHAFLNIPDGAGNRYLQIQGAYRSQDGSDQSSRSSGWIHVAMTFNGRILELYVNGRVETSRGTETVDSGVDDTPIRYAAGNSNTDILIGGDPGNLSGGVSGSATLAGFPFDGKIDQVAIWNKALDADAITRIYDEVNDGITNEPLRLFQDSGDYDYSSALVGYWTLDEGSGTTTEDESSNSNDGTLLNAPIFSSDLPI